MAKRGVVVALLLLAATACGDEIATPATSSTSPPTRPPAQATTTLSLPPEASAVRLLADGLGVAAFGDPKDATVAALTAALGPPGGIGKGCELAGSDANTVIWRELAVQFVGGRFQSYTLRPAPRDAAVLGLKTPEGAAIGTTVAELKAAYGSRVKIPGLPPEFGGRDFRISFPGTSRTLIGALTANADDGRVTSFFTSTCE